MENTNSIEQAIPRFEIGQRVVIIGKTMQPFTDSLEGYLDSPTITLTASHLIEHGYVSIIDIIFKDDTQPYSYLLDLNECEDYFYICGDALNPEIGGDFFLERDLIDYEEYIQDIRENKDEN